jgi:hypothetical protein
MTEIERVERMRALQEVFKNDTASDCFMFLSAFIGKTAYALDATEAQVEQLGARVVEVIKETYGILKEDEE